MQIPCYLIFIEGWVYGHTECVKSQILYPLPKSGTSPGDAEYITPAHQEAAISAPGANPVTKQNITYLLPSVGFEPDIWLTVVTIFFSTYPLHWAITPVIREQFGTTTGYDAIHSSTHPSWHVSGQYGNVGVATTTVLPTLSANLYKLLFVSTIAARSLVKGQDPIRLQAVLTLNHHLSSHQWLCGRSMTHGSGSGHLVQLQGTCAIRAKVGHAKTSSLHTPPWNTSL